MRLRFMELMCVAVGVLGATSSNANAAFMDGEELHKACQEMRKDERTFTAPMCMGFIEGVIDSINATTFGICFPKGVRAGTVSDIVTNFLEKEPQERQYSGFEVVVKAFIKAYPCK